jgi:hypothetical protein
LTNTNTTLATLRGAFANPNAYEGHAAANAALAGMLDESRPLVRPYVLENSTSDWLRHQALSWDRDTFEDDRLLRHVEMNLGSWVVGKQDKHTLLLWDTYTRDPRYGKSILGYRFSDAKGRVIFEGEDFHCSPMSAIDSDDAVKTILRFLSTAPGDTDDEYFANYTKAQLEFADTKAEELSMFTDEDEPSEFTNLDRFVSSWEVELHGIEHSDSFRGASQGDWGGIAVGIGMDEAEALECALDQLSDAHEVGDIDWTPGDLVVDLDAIALEQGVDVEELEDTPYVHIVVRVR